MFYIKFESFIPCSERIVRAVTDMVLLFPEVSLRFLVAIIFLNYLFHHTHILGLVHLVYLGLVYLCLFRSDLVYLVYVGLVDFIYSDLVYHVYLDLVYLVYLVLVRHVYLGLVYLVYLYYIILALKLYLDLFPYLRLVATYFCMTLEYVNFFQSSRRLRSKRPCTKFEKLFTMLFLRKFHFCSRQNKYFLFARIVGLF